jgi:hypothetical protein
MNKRRYSVEEGKGGKYDRFYVWDAQERRVYQGKLGKAEALVIEHNLNGRNLFQKQEGNKPESALSKFLRYISGGKARPSA